MEKWQIYQQDIMDIVDKISTGAIKHKHTYDWDSGQCVAVY